MTRARSTYGVGFGKPPRKTRFKRGKSGNPKGRPKGSKNFDTVLAQELNGKVPITENGRERKVSKREVIAKQLVNKAASGDLRATQTVFNETRVREEEANGSGSLEAFDTPEQRLVIADIVRRIRLMDEVAEPSEPFSKSPPRI